MNQNQQFDVIVIGGGAAGLMCAITAGQRGRKVVILEKGPRIGRKILISGGGRCNFTNTKTLSTNFLSDNSHFCKSALSRYTPNDFIKLVEKYGIAYHEKKLGQLFCDESARDIVNILQSECKNAGVEIVTDCEVKSIQKNEEFIIETGRGRFTGNSLVVATGGLAVSKYSTDFGYEIARQFGLRMTDFREALVPLTLSGNEWSGLAELAGVSLDVIVTCRNVSFRENILFTHRGLSGPAILQISSYWKQGEKIVINLTPDGSLEKDLLLAKANGEKTELRNWLAQKFPKSFVDFFTARYFPTKPINQCADKMFKNLAEKLSRWEIAPAGTLGYEKAEVTVGGVDTNELSSKTMEAKKVPGLYFIGEVVDVTGWLGGFNFQWAWSSGHAAGEFA